MTEGRGWDDFGVEGLVPVRFITGLIMISLYQDYKKIIAF
jgi:hypothetical protein